MFEYATHYTQIHSFFAVMFIISRFLSVLGVLESFRCFFGELFGGGCFEVMLSVDDGIQSVLIKFLKLKNV